MKNYLLILVIFLASCTASRRASVDTRNTSIRSTVVLKKKVAARSINTKDISAESVVKYAETFLGYPYKYGSASPEKGFDCSGFIFYVFNKFRITVPRTSVEYTNAGTEVTLKEARRGDIILFTGSDARSGVVGHMGIITANNNNHVQFIHSASGDNGGIMISAMNAYFIPRFVKVNRIFKIM